MSTNQIQPIIKLENVELSFDEDRGNVLDGISLSINQGEHLCILGANGSGKSTLAQVIAGMMAPDSGSVYLCNNLVYSNETKAIAQSYRQARQNIGYVFQDPQDQIIANITENDIAFGPENLGLDPDEITKRVEHCLEVCSLSEYRTQDPSYLSGGTQQRVAIAGALALQPNIFVADEPCAMLDVKGRNSTMALINEMSETGKTIVHITHFIEHALGADKVIVLDKGKVALSGTPSFVFSQITKLGKLGLDLPFKSKLKLALLKEELPQITNKPKVEDSVVIKADDICFNWPYSSDMTLNHINLNVLKGECISIVGKTGSGKSTLAKILSALETPNSGSLEVLGIDITNKKMRSRIRGRVGYVMQKPERQLFAETVYQDVAYGPANQRLSEHTVDYRVNTALEMLGIKNLKDVSPFDLSDGQKRVVAIAGVLAMSPEILILDEPTAGLDPKGRANLISLLKKLNNSGTTIVLITHSMDIAASLSHRVCVLDKGSVEMCDITDTVFLQKDKLEAMGLGIPTALEWSMTHNFDLGAPLTLEELTNQIINNNLSQEVLALNE